MGEALFRQKNGLVAVNIAAACGVFTPGQFQGLAEAVREAGAGALKLTSRQTVVLILEEDKIAGLAEKISGLGLRIAPYGNAIRSVKACSGGPGLCPRALADALGLGIELQNRYMGQDVPKDFKIAVAGCIRGCTDPHCADFGLIACGKDAYRVLIGGRGGSPSPERGKVILEQVRSSRVPEVLDFVLARYRELAEPGERLCKTVGRVGLKEFIPPFIAEEPAGSLQDDEFGEFLRSGE
ncbi:sulfite reductase, beta subunit [Pelotomaculum thermopropionicum SI]|uniref:Sulfite reductase, beta subunit n=1 Tax=Pelotomaculum thermopropionicum (strain DSM 13744 / JCM 10971 / SI) TaxID=370438 RepID=A5D3K4_PELTS|nr:sulfite reductase, beta subunit [Pelotomaculum thermopropionicum SI]